MAGPTATILVANKLTTKQTRFLGDTIHSISSDDVCDDFCVVTTRPIGGCSDFAGRPFISSSGQIGNPLTFGYSELELEQIGKFFNIAPIVSFSFSAICNDRLDHEILARLCIYIANEFSGIIDLNGDIGYDANKHNGLYSIEHQNHLYQTASRHICRPEFLATYLSQDDFRMVK